MTISSTTRIAGPYTGTGSQSVYSFGFKVFQASDVLVTLTDTSGNLTTQTLTSQYSVTLNANQNTTPGGTITMVTAPPTGYTLVIGSQVPVLQPADLTNAGNFYPQVINDALDRLTILLQQNQIGRALSVPEITGLAVLPPAAQRANLILSFDSSGNPILVAPSSGSATALATNLATSTDPTKGAGQLAYGNGVAYGARTVGGVLNGQGAVDNFRSNLLLAGNGGWANPASGDTQHLFEIVNDNGPYQCMAMNAYGAATNGNNFHWNRYFGTLAAPTPVQSAAYFMSHGYRGWDGTGVLSQSMAAHQAIATENWDATHHGIKFHWELTKTGGSSSRLPAFELSSTLSDSVIVLVGDGSSLFSRIVNNGTTGALQIHGSGDQTGAQTIWFGSATVGTPNQAWHRADLISFEDRSGNETLNINPLTQQMLIKGTGGFGYTAGAGLSNTQSVAKTDGVTANVPSLKVTMNAAALGGGSAVSFVWTSSKIGADDHVIVTIRGGAGGGAYNAWCDQVSAGSARIVLKNITGGSLSDAVVLQLSVIKGASS